MAVKRKKQSKKSPLKSKEKDELKPGECEVLEGQMELKVKTPKPAKTRTLTDAELHTLMRMEKNKILMELVQALTVCQKLGGSDNVTIENICNFLDAQIVQI